MNIAIIGYSGMGRWHARVIEEIEGLNLVGTYTVSEKGRSLARENGLFVYRNIMAAIEGKEQLLITHEEIMRVMKLMEAVIESGENNTVITDFEER